MNRIHLASASPRRRELLERLGLRVELCPSHIEEVRRPGEDPEAFALRAAREKLEASGPFPPGEAALAADTIVVIDGGVLGKPRHADEAARMLGTIQDRWHTVFTGLAVAFGGAVRSGVEASRVKIAPLSAAEIDWYVATGEPMDKAGAYALQGIGGLFVERVEGSCSNVIGLPLPLLRRFLSSFGLFLPPA
jgi:septum formation protein